MGENVKFFKDNVIDSNGTFTLTSANTNLTSYLYDNDYTTQLESSGSDDVTPEVWEVEFTAAKTIDRIFIGNHNIKSGELKYWNGAAWASFSSAVSWSGNTADYSYFEVTQVSTLKLQLTMNTTIVVDAEKKVGQLRAMESIGEVGVNPSDVKFSWKKRKQSHTTATGGNALVVFGKKYQGKFTFSDADLTDVALFETLDDLNESFFIYPNGGDTAKTNYGFRIEDLFLVNFVNDFAPNLKAGLLGIGSVVTMQVAEV